MKARKSSLSFFGWAFGISLSILFGSLWGRAVMIDTDTLGESLAPMSRSDLVVGYLTEWMADEMVESGVDPAVADPAVDQLVNSSRVRGTLDRFAAEVVAASASPNPDGSEIDVRDLVTPAIPEVTTQLAGMGFEVSESQVSSVVEGLDPLVIREPGSPAIVGPSSSTATHLGTASLLAMLGLVVFGSGYLAVSDDRVGALRSLVTRIAVSGLTFGLMLRVGSWVLDPQGGRAPIRESLSAIAGSKWLVPFQMGLVAAGLAALIYLATRSFKQRAMSRSRAGTPTSPPERSRSVSERR